MKQLLKENHSDTVLNDTESYDSVEDAPEEDGDNQLWDEEAWKEEEENLTYGWDQYYTDPSAADCSVYCDCEDCGEGSMTECLLSDIGLYGGSFFSSSSSSMDSDGAPPNNYGWMFTKRNEEN